MVSLVDELSGRLRQAAACRPGAGVVRRKAMVGVAMTGYERCSFSMPVNDRQMAALNETVPLFKAAEVRFLRLIPAQGG